MKKLANRGLAMLMAFVMIFSLLPVMEHTAHAANETVEYVYSGNYIYNWGSRGTTATFLSPNAEKFYTGSYTYDNMSQLSGAASTSSVSGSDLYQTLQTLMVNKQTYQTSYNATRDLYQYTDCQNSGLTSKKISSFYSGKEIGPAWDSGSTWNREHTWPNSKGDASGNGENDIMMLRPASVSENGSRSNKAYGESSGYYYPNSESGDKYDVRGDVARIMLYVYVRWGNTERMWGSDGVIESKEVLLKWMKDDPVDTWELGRNDSVESITGTRNVFVDYPEYAFLLFNEEIPNTMTTPSGEAQNTVNCQHNYVAGSTVPATCTTAGKETFTCSECGRSYEKSIPAIGHNYVNGVCSVCGTEKPAGSTVMIYYPSENLYVTSTASGSKLAGGTEAQAAKWTMSANENGYYSFVTEGKYLTSGTSGNSLSLSSTLTNCGLWEVIECQNGIYLRNIGAAYNGTYNQYLEYYSGFTTYGFNESKANIYTFQLKTVGSGETTECEHTWKDATCTLPKTCSKCGATDGEALGHAWSVATCKAPKTCSVCGATEGEKADHSYVDGKCSVCGEEKPSASQTTTATVSIANYAAANGWVDGNSGGKPNTSLTIDENVTVTVSGGSNTGKYYASSGGSWRIYQTESPSIVVSAGDATIISVKITYTNSNNGILTYNGANITSGTAVDVNASSATFGVGNTGTKTNGQVRISAIEVVYTSAAAEPECSHDWTDATCTLPKTCSKCGATDGEALGHDWTDATCKAPKTCSVCGATEGEKADHNYVDGKCSVCDEADPNFKPDTAEPTTVSVSIANYAAANGWVDGNSGGKPNTSLTIDENVTVTVSGGSNTGKYYASSGGSWRIYQTESPSIVVSAGDATIISVKITYTNSNNGILTYNGANITSGTAVDVNAPSATFGVGNTGTKTNGQVRISAIEVVYTSAAAEPECSHDWTDATCTLPKTCSKCGATDGEALGHAWTDATCKAPKTCSVCGATEGEKADHNYVDGKCSVCGEEKAEESTDTIVMIYYPAGNLYVTATASGKRLAGGTKAQAAEWTMTMGDNGYYSFVSGGKYLTSGAAGNEVYLSGTLTNCGLWEVIDCQNGVYLRNIGAAYNGTNNQYLEYYNGFTTYGFNNSNASVYTFRLETVTGGEGGETGGETGCSHSYTSTVTTAPTCTTPGLVTYTCECGDSYTQTVAPTGHAYIGGKCVRCGSAAYVPPVIVTPEVTVPTTGNETAAQVEVSVAGSKVTIQDIDLTENGNTADESNASVTIDLSGMNTEISEVAIPADMFDKIADAAVDSTQNMEIVLSEGLAIEFNVAALGEQMKLAGGKDLTVSIIPSEDAVLTSKQQETVGQNIAYDINMTSGGKHISDMGGQITVSAPYELKNGEKAGGLVVYYVDENGNRERCVTYYDAETKSVKWNTNHLSLYMLDYDENRTEACDGSATCPVHAFTDAKTDAWYHNGVHYCLANGLMDGIPGNLFDPNGTTTRAQLVTILWRLEGKPVVNYLMQFDDVASDSWYTEAVRWAAAEKIVEGHDGKFDPNGAITREQLATILYRYEQYKGGGFTGTWMFLLDCTDRDKVSNWAYEAMCWMSMNGVITGTDGALNPKNNATRAQIAMTLYRYCEATGKED